MSFRNSHIFTLLVLAGVTALTPFLSHALVNPSVSIENLTLGKQTYQAGDLITGTFAARNRDAEPITDIGYSIELVASYADGVPDVIVEELPASERFNLQPAGRLEKTFSYRLPKNLPSGEYGIRISLFSGKGGVLGWSDIRINVTGGEGTFAPLADPRIIWDGQPYEAEIGISLPPDQAAVIRFGALNISPASFTLRPKIKVFRRHAYGELLREYHEAEFVLRPQDWKTVYYKLPPLNVPESYLAEIALFDTAGERASNRLLFRWVVEGVGGEILSIVSPSPKENCRKQNATIEYAGPADATAVGGPAELVVKVIDAGEVIGETRQAIELTTGRTDVVIQTSRCAATPQIAAELIKDGKVIDSHTITQLPAQTKGRLLFALAAALILAAIAAAAIFFKRKYPKAVPPIAALLLLGLLSAFVWLVPSPVEMHGSVVIVKQTHPDVTLTWNLPTHGQTFKIGDDITFDGKVDIPSCWNRFQYSELSYFLTDNNGLNGVFLGSQERFSQVNAYHFNFKVPSTVSFRGPSRAYVVFNGWRYKNPAKPEQGVIYYQLIAYEHIVIEDAGGPVPIPKADIKANGLDGPITITLGAPVTIDWTSENVNECRVRTISRFIGRLIGTGTSGTEVVPSVPSSTIFSLTCTGDFGPAFDSVAVDVSGATASAVCNNLTVTFNWTSSKTCTDVSVLTDGNTIASGLGCPGNFDWLDAAFSTTYAYEIKNKTPNFRIGTGIFTTPPPQVCPLPNQPPVAVATISSDDVNYADSIVVIRGAPTLIFLSAAGSSDPDNWADLTNGVLSGGKCEWNSDLNQGAPTFETTKDSPATPEDCKIQLDGNPATPAIDPLTFNDDPGTYTYSVLRITDRPSAVSTVDTVSITVSVGTGPLANPGPAHALTVGTTHTHTGASASDPDGNLASYAWTWVTPCPGGTCPSFSGSASGSLSGGSASVPGPTFTPNTAGSYTLQVVVSDTAGNTDTKTVTESAGVPNSPPTASAGPAHALSVGTAHTHSGGSASDPNGNLSSYSWSFTACPGACPGLSGATGSLSGGSAAVPGPTYTPNASGGYTLQLIVFDSDGLSGNSTITENTSAATTIDLNVNPPIIAPGQCSTLSWTTSGFTSCTLTGPGGTVIITDTTPDSGSQNACPIITTAYTLTCNPGSVSDTETITVLGVPKFKEIPPR